jgi:very-short-patch-repair endonuclease
MSYQTRQAFNELVQLQAGVISRRQALDAGMPPGVIDARIRAGRWLPVHRGVYSVFTGQPPREAVLWAAVHRVGPGAALSHQSAAELFKLVDRPSALIHVMVPEPRRVRPLAGVVIHYSARMAETIHPGLKPPRTRIEETVLDLADQAATFDVAFSLVSAGCQRRLTTAAQISEAMTKRSRLRWRRELARALGQVSMGAHSLLEFWYLHRVERAHGLPTATRQARVIQDGRNRYLDNLYSEYGLCVELDGLQAHPDDQRWQDQRRANAIIEQGLSILRYGWTDVDRRPCQVATQVASVLGRLGWPGRARQCGHTCPVAAQPDPVDR